MPDVLSRLEDAVSVIHTASVVWFSYEYFQQTPEQRIGVSER